MKLKIKNNILLKIISLLPTFIFLPVIALAEWSQPAAPTKLPSQKINEWSHSAPTALPPVDANIVAMNFFTWQLGLLILQLILVLGVVLFLSIIYYFLTKKVDYKAKKIKKVIKFSIINIVILIISYLILIIS